MGTEKKIGENIDKIREARGWSKEELARRMNEIPASLYRHINEGKMSVSFLLRYAEALGCTAGDLTEGAADLTAFTLDTDIAAWYPYNLAAAVMQGAAGFKHDNPKNPKVSDEDRERLYRVYVPALMKSLEELTERERKVLELRYRNGFTLARAGKEFGVTQERVRQIEAKAIRKLRHPRRYKTWIKDTLNKAWDIAAERDRLKLENVTLKNKLAAIMRETSVPDERIEPALNAPKEAEDVTLAEMYKTDGMSVRAYNVLMRHFARNGNYEPKLSDLQGMTCEELKKVRNMGRKSYEEVVRLMARRGAKPMVEA